MRKRQEFRYNPLDFEVDVAIGLTLPLTNDMSIAEKYLPDNGAGKGLNATAAGVAVTSVQNDPTKDKQKSSTQGDFHLSYTTKEQTFSNLRNLVLTNRGERVMHPEFGCDIWASLFDNITPNIIKSMKKRIEKQVSIWLPYVNLIDVRIKHNDTQTGGTPNQLNIAIDWAQYGNYMDKETVVIEVGNQ
tara:strand:- start:1503 stop:2066 length:564 start_codon:yes stop_codon:yes gene_type:complete